MDIHSCQLLQACPVAKAHNQACSCSLLHPIRVLYGETMTQVGSRATHRLQLKQVRSPIKSYNSCFSRVPESRCALRLFDKEALYSLSSELVTVSVTTCIILYASTATIQASYPPWRPFCLNSDRPNNFFLDIHSLSSSSDRCWNNDQSNHAFGEHQARPFRLRSAWTLCVAFLYAYRSDQPHP